MSTTKKIPEIDQLLGQVWSKYNSILPEIDFLNCGMTIVLFILQVALTNLFSFFNRRTTYLAETGNAKKVLQLVNRYIDEAKQQKLEREKERDREAQKEKDYNEKALSKKKDEAKTEEAHAATASTPTDISVGIGASIGTDPSEFSETTASVSKQTDSKSQTTENQSESTQQASADNANQGHPDKEEREEEARNERI
ncbi:bromodomain-containing protein [Reticulomyxa filosa]|uniref:Bromodomain-containing protein n=1 Tax=Reticulomyxa filosa TaxID=46433 RepID=X6MVY1_RETFI|nr:bromodomain-containing protein [Reticulomyxa filosa]|eukprot:ETO17260.1 bromodomain-containing protein [Reticulomyxa filosa]